MEKVNISYPRLSTEAMLALADTDDRHVIIPLTDDAIEFNHRGLERMQQVLECTDAPFVYSDYYEDGKLQKLIPYQMGSLRDDFDFGKIVMVKTDRMKQALAGVTERYNAAGWYDLRLRLTRDSIPAYCPEPLYCSVGKSAEYDERQHFAYVDPRNRESQIELEKAATRHLDEIGAIIKPCERIAIDVSEGDFPVEASVIIPVRNRRRTISDAVKSALSQKADFRYNVIVVDNRSDDGTTEILREISDKDARLKVIETAELPYGSIGIGGCWNLAIGDVDCGRFAIQLDSDDVYSSPETLQKIVDKFRAENCAMVIGSYTLTDFDRNVIPPGLIDHAEWTDENGANNALRINGLGAPRSFYTPVARKIGFPDVCYGEDYAMGLAISRDYHIGRIYESLYLCRRWEDNTDHALTREKINANNYYKDTIRTIELTRRKNGKRQ